MRSRNASASDIALLPHAALYAHSYRNRAFAPPSTAFLTGSRVQYMVCKAAEKLGRLSG